MQCKPNLLYNFLIIITQASILVQLVCGACERHAGLMVSTFDSRLKGPGSSPGRLIVLCLGQDTSVSQCLSPPRSINGYP